MYVVFKRSHTHTVCESILISHDKYIRCLILLDATLMVAVFAAVMHQLCLISSFSFVQIS